MEKLTLFSAKSVYIQQDVDSKKQLFEALADNFCQANDTLSAPEIFSALIERERLGGTGLGRGIAIPHIRFDAVTRPLLQFVQLAKPVDYDSADKQPVDLVLALLVPSNANEEHLQLLSRIAKMFSNSQLCEQLRRCRDNSILAQLLEQHCQPQDTTNEPRLVSTKVQTQQSAAPQPNTPLQYEHQ